MPMIEDARAQDAALLAPLIYSSGPAAFDYVFMGRALAFLQRNCAGQDHSFSYGAHRVARLAADGPAMASISLHTRAQHAACQNANIRAILRFGGWRAVQMLMRGLRVEALIPPPPEGCLHIAHLGVAPDLRGQGIGAQLIADAAHIAARQGIRRLSLDVADSNPRARALYERLGFEPCRTHISRIAGLADHHLLIKSLD